MRKRLQTTIVLVLMVVVTGGWGFLVHKTANQLAVYQLPKKMRPFFYQHMNYLVNNAPRPDTRRNTDSAEAPRHFIDFEMYGADAATKMPMEWERAVELYSKDSLFKYGYVPYHILYMKEKLTEAFRNGNPDSILFYATDLAHYIGDAHVPLHTTVNYDGQLTGQKGLHSLWESALPEVELEGYNLYSGHKASYLAKPEKAVWQALRGSFALVPAMLDAEKKLSANFTDATKYQMRGSRGREYRAYSTPFAKAYGGALHPSVNAQLLNSAKMIADFWYTCWVDANRPVLPVIKFSDEQSLKYREESRSAKDNTLIAKQLLLSRLPVSPDKD